MAITTTYKAIADLDTGAARMNIVQPLATYDDSAHVFAVEIRRGSSAEELSGTTCIGYFVRADGVTIPIDGDVKGNVATVILAANCYAVAGGFALAVKLSMGNVVHTVLRATGNVSVSQTDEMASPGTGVQSFDKLVEAAEKAEGYDARITETEKTVDTLVEQTQKIPLSIRAKNLLDNSWFANPINQRGLNNTTANWNYFIDRWMLAATDATPVYFDVNSSYRCVGFSTETGADVYLVQRLPLGVLTQGKLYTWAYETLEGAVYSGVIGGFEETPTSTQFVVQLKNHTYLKWIALYEGEYDTAHLPTYVYKGYAAELAECQRYYRRSLTGMFVGVSTNAAQYNTVNFSPMRIAPTVATTALNGNNVEIVYVYIDGFCVLNNNVNNAKITWEASADL